jgi:uncharacterized protein YdeI (YjbR/CyaY-like superfamily)
VALAEELDEVVHGDEFSVPRRSKRHATDTPSDLAAALQAAPDALHYFESLSYSRQRWFTLNVEDAKTPETRARRIERAVARLRDGG